MGRPGMAPKARFGGLFFALASGGRSGDEVRSGEHPGIALITGAVGGDRAKQVGGRRGQSLQFDQLVTLDAMQNQLVNAANHRQGHRSAQRRWAAALLLIPLVRSLVFAFLLPIPLQRYFVEAIPVLLLFSGYALAWPIARLQELLSVMVRRSDCSEPSL